MEIGADIGLDRGHTTLIPLIPIKMMGDDCSVRISARTDYAIRAVVHLASSAGTPVPVSGIAEEQQIPTQFLELIMTDLRRSGLVRSQRGARGGFTLARPAEHISLADIVRAVDGSLASIRGERPEDVTYEGSALALQQVWIAVRWELRAILENVSAADILAGTLPPRVHSAIENPDAWVSR